MRNNFVNRSAVWTVTMVILAIIAQSSHAQINSIEQFERRLRLTESKYFYLQNPSLSVGERMLLDYGGSLTFSTLFADDSTQETHILRQTDAQIYTHLNIDDIHTFYTRLRFNYLDYNSGDDFDNNGDEYRYPLMDRWWYQFDLRRAIETTDGLSPDYNIRVKVGRQYVHWAAGMVLSEQLYAIRTDLELGHWLIESIVGTTPSSSVIDIDTTRPDYDADTERLFVGGRLVYRGNRTHTPYIYLMHQDDNNHHDPVAITVPGFPTVYPTSFDYSSTYLGLGSEGQLSSSLFYDAVFIWQTGDTMSTTITPGGFAVATQTRDQINAWAARFNLTYYTKDTSDTEFEFEVILASGDDDRDFNSTNTFGGNTPDTRDHAFNSFGFAHTGLANPATLSNLMLFRTGVSTYPLAEDRAFKRLRIGADILVFNKFDDNAPIDEPTDDHRYIGTEADIFIDWRVSSDVSVNIRYGVFFPGDAIQTDDDMRHFLYTGISYAF